MIQRAILTILFLFLSSCSASAPSSSKASHQSKGKELEQIDAAIQKLTDLRNLELAKAARAQDQGDRLQFNQNQLMDARRYWQQAENSREIAARFQEEIDKLERQRKKLLQKYRLVDPKQP